CALPFLCASLSADDLIVDLRNPTFEEGTLFTDEGGVIHGEDLRIQAQSIAYTRKAEDTIHEITAEGDLMVEYQGHAFIGKRIEFDLNSHEGVLYEGKAATSDLYVGGEKVLFHSDGTYEIEGATLTNSPNKESSWDLHAEKVQGIPQESISLQDVSLRLLQTPTIWLPSVKWNFPKRGNDSEVRTTVKFDLSSGPTFSMRYPLYSWQNLSLFSRLQYRLTSDIDGAFEAQHTASNGRSRWASQNILTSNLNDIRSVHYRLKGEHLWNSENEKTKTALTWDKSSDTKTAKGSFGKDFSVNPSGETALWLSHQESYALFNLKARPSINSFESVRESLPAVSLHFLPRPLGSTGILSLSEVKASYLRFSSSHPAESQAGKCELEQKFYRPTQMGLFTLTPYLGAIGQLSTNSPSQKPSAFGLGLYGLDLSLDGHRMFQETLHRLQPYASFSGIKTSDISPESRYIFSIQDGYHEVQQAQVGVRNHFFLLDDPGTPFLSTDFFAHLLLPNTTPNLSP
ncbi:MAG: hypothetical protein HY324_03275, partial [Chlamydiia bacterium]|nr:hypothetical protein [Chlamydiia bacterium]